MPNPRFFVAVLVASAAALLIPFVSTLAVLYASTGTATDSFTDRAAGWLLTRGFPAAFGVVCVVYGLAAWALARRGGLRLGRFMLGSSCAVFAVLVGGAEALFAWRGQSVPLTEHLWLLTFGLVAGWLVAMGAWSGAVAGGLVPPIEPKPRHRPTVFETLFVLVFCFGIFIVSAVVVALSGLEEAAFFTDSGNLGMVALEFFIGLCTLMVLRRRRYAMSDFVPTPTWKGSVIGLALAVAAWCASLAFMRLFDPALLETQPIAQIIRGSQITLAIVLLLSVMNGWFEEAFLLGFFTRQFARYGPVVAVGFSLVLRTSFHLYQGWIGAIEIALLGLIFTLYYWRTRKLWPVVFAHMLVDMVGLGAMT